LYDPGPTLSVAPEERIREDPNFTPMLYLGDLVRILLCSGL